MDPAPMARKLQVQWEPALRPPWLQVDRMLGEWRIPEHTANTTMPLAWAVERLHMGSRRYLTWLLQHQNKAKGEQTDTLI